jgi:hypothetical protein
MNTFELEDEEIIDREAKEFGGSVHSRVSSSKPAGRSLVSVANSCAVSVVRARTKTHTVRVRSGVTTWHRC